MNANPFVLNALQVTDRKPTIRTAQPQPHTPSRLAAVAGELSLRGYALSRAELLSEALQAAAAMCYEQDTDGSLANVDIDGRCLCPLPWGRTGHRKWGLRRTEGEVLRTVMMDWSKPSPGQPVPLWTWDDLSRGWYLNLEDYPIIDAATAFLRARSITSRLYKRYLQRLHAERKT